MVRQANCSQTIKHTIALTVVQKGQMKATDSLEPLPVPRLLNVQKGSRDKWERW